MKTKTFISEALELSVKYYEYNVRPESRYGLRKEVSDYVDKFVDAKGVSEAKIRNALQLLFNVEFVYVRDMFRNNITYNLSQILQGQIPTDLKNRMKVALTPVNRAILNDIAKRFTINCYISDDWDYTGVQHAEGSAPVQNHSPVAAPLPSSYNPRWAQYADHPQPAPIYPDAGRFQMPQQIWGGVQGGFAHGGVPAPQHFAMQQGMAVPGANFPYQPPRDRSLQARNTELFRVKQEGFEKLRNLLADGKDQIDFATVLQLHAHTADEHFASQLGWQTRDFGQAQAAFFLQQKHQRLAKIASAHQRGEDLLTDRVSANSQTISLSQQEQVQNAVGVNLENAAQKESSRLLSGLAGLTTNNSASVFGHALPRQQSPENESEVSTPQQEPSLNSRHNPNSRF